MRLCKFLTWYIRSSIPTSVDILELTSKTVHTMTNNRWQSPDLMNNLRPAWNQKATLCSSTHGTHNRNNWNHTHTLKWRQDIIGTHIKFSSHKQNMLRRRILKAGIFPKFPWFSPMKYLVNQGTKLRTEIPEDLEESPEQQKRLSYMTWMTSTTNYCPVYK